MFTLRIFVMGFVALVPNENYTNLTLLLPVAPDKHVHVPVIVYPCGPAKVYCDPHDAQSVHDKLNLDVEIKDGRLFLEDKTFGALHLKGVYIDVSDLPSGYLSFSHGRRQKGWFGNPKALPETMAEVADFSWIPRMADIAPESSVIKEELISEPKVEETAALMRLIDVEGECRTASLAKDGPVIPALNFKTADSIFERSVMRQALADTFVIEIQVNKPMVELSTVNFEGAVVNKIPIAPQLGARFVDILIGNLTPLPPRNSKARIRPRIVDISQHFGEHFHLYYDLATKKPSKLRIPFGGRASMEAEGIEPSLSDVIRVVSRDGGVSGNSRPICTIVSFDGQ